MKLRYYLSSFIMVCSLVLGIKISAAEEISHIVLPIVKTEDGKIIIWSETNEWQLAFRALPMKPPFIQPIGDLEDQTLFNETSVQHLQADAFHNFLARYQASDIILLWLEQEYRSEGQNQGQTYFVKGEVINKHNQRNIIYQDILTNNQSKTEDWHALATATFKKLEENIEKGMASISDSPATQTLSNQALQQNLWVQVDSLQEWHFVRQVLENLKHSANLEVLSLNKNRIEVVCELAPYEGGGEGAKQALQEELKLRGFLVEDAANGVWQVKYQSAPTDNILAR